MSRTSRLTTLSKSLVSSGVISSKPSRSASMIRTVSWASRTSVPWPTSTGPNVAGSPHTARLRPSSSLARASGLAHPSDVLLQPPTAMGAFPVRFQPFLDGAIIEAKHELTSTTAEVVVEQCRRFVDVAERKAPTTWWAEHVYPGQWP